MTAQPAPAASPAADGVSPLLLRALEAFEGFSAAPYLCSAGKPTIGFGTTRYPNGRAVSLADPPITREQAGVLATHDLRAFLDDLKELVKVPLSPAQHTALVLFLYNIGRPNFQTSTLLRRLNAGDYAAAAAQFPAWNKERDRKTGMLVRSLGLARRREAERLIFTGVDPAEAKRRAWATIQA